MPAEPRRKDSLKIFDSRLDATTHVNGVLFNGEPVDYYLEDFIVETQGRDGIIKKRQLSPGDEFPLWVTKDQVHEIITVQYLGVARSGQSTEWVPVVNGPGGQTYLLKRTAGPNVVDRGQYFLDAYTSGIPMP